MHARSSHGSQPRIMANDCHRVRYSGWLQKLKKVCKESGIVLIFDEVYTGFRLGPGGAQEYFNCQVWKCARF